jgi:hypothetical protein
VNQETKRTRKKSKLNGADGIGDIEGKAAMGSGERAWAASEFQWSGWEPRHASMKIDIERLAGTA